MSAQQQDRLDAEDVDDAVFEPVHVPGDGPHDVEDLDPEVTLGAGTVDFGAVRVPVPERGSVAVDPSEKGRMQAVHVSVPEGRLSVSALAAPRSSRLWPELVKEIDASLREGGARVRSFQGDWGRELHATSGAATSLFVGVDGARWMLYGVATGPTRDAGVLDEQLRRMMRGTIVVRGRSPYPVRTVLPLEVPEQLAAPDAGRTVLELRPLTDAGQRSAPTAAYPAEAAPAPPPPAPPTTALPVAAPPEVSPPTTALPVHRIPPNGSRPVDAAQQTTALPVAPPRGHVSWSDPVHHIVDPDERPTDIRPAAVVAPPTGRRPALGSPGGSETAPWALDPPAPPSSGGRRRLREPGDHLPVSPGLTGPWAPWPENPTGSGRAVGPAEGRGTATSGPGAVPTAGAGRRRADEGGPLRWGAPHDTAVPPGHATGPVADARPGRRRLADVGPADARPVDARPVDARPDAVPAPLPTFRRRGPDPAPTEALVAVPAVLRVGRHAVVESPQDRTARAAETQPSVAARRGTEPGPVTETAPWAVSRPPVSQPPVSRASGYRPSGYRPSGYRPSGYRAEDGPVTEPLRVQLPASERPTGRHHRPS